MPNYLYNGIELPALPEWDKETYPYAMISDHETNALLPSGYEFIVAKSPVINSFSFGDETECMAVEAILDDQRNVIGWSEFDGTVYTESSLGGVIIWVNHNMYDTYGNGYPGDIIMYANEPIPVYEEQTIPLTYLYNGVELPRLPEWDKEKFPYAVISGSTLYCFECAWYVYLRTIGSSNTKDYIAPKDTEKRGYMIYDHSDSRGDIDWYYRRNGCNNLSAASIIWSNFDILRDDGTTYLAASDPVPVLSLTDIDLYRNVNGKLVGHTLYKKVGVEFVPLDDHIMA